jgi:hypothetical protein
VCVRALCIDIDLAAEQEAVAAQDDGGGDAGWCAWFGPAAPAKPDGGRRRDGVATVAVRDVPADEAPERKGGGQALGFVSYRVRDGDKFVGTWQEYQSE